MFNPVPQFYITDPALKSIDWANIMITNYRIYWVPLVDPVRAADGMSYLLGEHNNDYTKKMFHKPDEAGVDFSPIKVWEKIRNVLTAGIEDAGVNIDIQAVDTSSINQKQRDKILLKNQKDMNEFLTQMRGSIGLPPFKLEEHKEDGKKTFAGNVDKFKEMGLDENSPSDIQHFFETHYRLDHEIKAETIIGAISQFNELSSLLPMYCNDILAKKAVASRTYVNELSGVLEVKYRAPETIKIVMGRRPDGKDAWCIGEEVKLFVKDFLAMVGNEFDLYEDMPQLLLAVNFTNNTEFTGVGADNYIGNRPERRCEWNMFMNNYMVSVGYIEFKSIDAKGMKVGKDYHGNFSARSVSPATEIGDRSKFEKELRQYETIYKSVYLVTGIASQVLYQYGKLPYQTIEGVNDEYANFSFSIYKDIGPTAVDVSKWHIRMLEKAAKKVEYLFNKIKGPGYSFNYDALVEVATKMYKTGSASADVMELLKLYTQTDNQMYTYANIDGKVVGGDGNPNKALDNNLKLFMEAIQSFDAIMDRCISKIEDQLGVQPQVQNTQPGEGLGLKTIALKSSFKSTQYMNRILQHLFNNIGVKIMLQTQSIIKFRKQKSQPYEALLNLTSEETLETIGTMDDVAMHRYGLFINSFNPAITKEEVKQFGQQALQAGKINMGQYLLIITIDNPKKAAQLLAYQEDKALKQQQQFAMQQQQQLLQADGQRHQWKMEELQLESQTRIESEKVRGQFYMESHKTSAEAQLQAVTEKVQQEIPSINAKKEANIEVAQAKKD